MTSRPRAGVTCPPPRRGRALRAALPVGGAWRLEQRRRRRRRPRRGDGGRRGRSPVRGAVAGAAQRPAGGRGAAGGDGAEDGGDPERSAEQRDDAGQQPQPGGGEPAVPAPAGRAEGPADPEVPGAAGALRGLPAEEGQASQPSSASLETLLALLQAEGAKIEEDTENMAEKFLDGELALDAFIDVYQSQRRLAHVRRVKIEKLQEMVLRRPRPPQAPAALLLPPRAPEPAPAAPLPYPAPEAGGAPSVLPRRIPPPVPAGRLATPFTAAMGSAQAPPLPGPLCPPVPPRVGLPPQQGFSAQFVSPFPPPLPQRPPPRLPHQPGFILQ
ncbi:vacuolar protein sorting-associated protein 37B isoform X1 [Phyllostomus hastatus]|uniref:vacuolar protein sorting-associated protein 37B isoform X1 n=1 Tax=Phyllostomus hastatus TaxID=9423 RepID=UPI001E6837AA|nr:vacuolar protein sorting-associated protein 37B isoform X1 [Phyllostomus hastatus]